MSAYKISGVAVSLYAEHDTDLAETIETMVRDTAFRLRAIERGPAGGTVTCIFAKRTEGVVVGGGNLVDLVYRLQRAFEFHGAHRVDLAGVSA